MYLSRTSEGYNVKNTKKANSAMVSLEAGNGKRAVGEIYRKLFSLNNAYAESLGKPLVLEFFL